MAFLESSWTGRATYRK